jgi:hypothetical protein
LNKKRDALRRGIRALIHDASKELVAFGGEEPRPAPPEGASGEVPAAAAPVEPPAHREAPSLNGGPAGHAHADRPHERAPSAEGLSLPLEAGTASERAVEPAVDAPAEDAIAAPPAGGNRGAAPAPPRSNRKLARPKRRREPAPARRAAPAPADDVDIDTAPPAQPEARTGVCRSYFVNHECWRVPNAYCNTALQVCVIRNCPVYHLHKDALEQRFAKKFKHFW